MIKTFETNKGKFYVHYGEVNLVDSFHELPNCKSEFIGIISDITEEQAKEVMDFLSSDWEFIYPIHTNKENDKYSEICLYAKQSLYSLLESLSITDTKNLYLFKIIE